MKTCNILILIIGIAVSCSMSAQTFDLNTDHTSITMKVKNLGHSADIFVTNNHVSETYIYSYTVEFTLKCGGTKTYSENNIGLKAGKTDDTGGHTISIPDVKGCEKGISGAKLLRFSAEKYNTPETNKQSSTVTATSGNAGENKDSKPVPNASPQEIATWQRSQYGSQPSKQIIQTSNQDKQTEDESKIQTIKNNNGASVAKLQQIINENNKRSEQLYGIKTYSSNTEMSNDLASGIGEIVGLFNANRELRRKDEERKERAAEAERLRKEAIQLKIATRKAILAELAAKDIPWFKRKSHKYLLFCICLR